MTCHVHWSTRVIFIAVISLAIIHCHMMAATIVICLTLALLRISTSTTVEVPSVTLNNAAQPGTNMPAVGIGTGAYMYAPTAPGEIWTDDVAEKAVRSWLKMGGRRVDASYSYRNQIGVGKAIASSQIPREELFIVSKVGNGGLISGAAMGYNDTLLQIDPILKSLQVEYVDLLLIHWPGPPGKSTDPACQGDPPTWRGCRQSTWSALEELYNTGKTRAIGVSNYEQNHLQEILDMGGLMPAVNQVEFHPYWHEDDLLAFCKKNNIVFNGYSPLSCPDWAPASHNWTHTLLQEPTIMKIAQAHEHSAAQVVLQWEWQQGVLVNPRTENDGHMLENLSFFNLKLTDDEVKEVSSITPPKNPKVCPDPHNLKLNE